MNGEEGWFTDIDTDQSGEYQWQPCLQLAGWCPSMPVWFKTEQECLDFIRTEIIGKELIHEPPMPSGQYGPTPDYGEG